MYIWLHIRIYIFVYHSFGITDGNNGGLPDVVKYNIPLAKFVHTQAQSFCGFYNAKIIGKKSFTRLGGNRCTSTF